MRRSAEALHGFYDGPLGRAVVQAVRPRLANAWGEGRGLDVLAVGYALPLLPPLPDARRVVAALPAAMGAHAWPPLARNAVALVPEAALPFPAALFDRVLIAHLLEEADDPHRWLVEAARVMAPAGRLAVVATSRTGLWAQAEGTPFGHGRPYSLSQLMAAMRAAGLEPQGSARVLYTPPHRAFVGAAGAFEAVGRALNAPVSGLVLVEAVRRAFAPRPAARRARVRLRPAFAPAVATALDPASNVSPHRATREAWPFVATPS